MWLINFIEKSESFFNKHIPCILEPLEEQDWLLWVILVTVLFIGFLIVLARKDWVYNNFDYFLLFIILGIGTVSYWAVQEKVKEFTRRPVYSLRLSCRGEEGACNIKESVIKNCSLTFNLTRDSKNKVAELSFTLNGVSKDAIIKLGNKLTEDNIKFSNDNGPYNFKISNLLPGNLVSIQIEDSNSSGCVQISDAWIAWEYDGKVISELAKIEN